MSQTPKKRGGNLLSAGGSGASSSEPKRTRHAAAASTASATPPHVQSPAERCHPDHMSFVMSFLGTTDFASSRRVCRCWSAASERQTAWPSFDLPRVFAAHASGDLDSTGTRRIDADAAERGMQKWDLHETETLARVLASPVWRRVSDLHVCSESGWDEECESGDTEFELHQALIPIEMHIFKQIAQLPNLRSLHLEITEYGGDDKEEQQLEAAITECFTALQPTLQALVVENSEEERREGPGPICKKISLLSNLRVLTLQQQADPAALLGLHSLEQLHFGVNLGPEVCRSIRVLSVQHRLRRLSVIPRRRIHESSTSLMLALEHEYRVVQRIKDGVADEFDLEEELRPMGRRVYKNIELVLTDLVRPMQEEGEAMPPAALTHVALDIEHLPAESDRALMALPQLQQLELRAEGALGEMIDILKASAEAAAAGSGVALQQQLSASLRSLIVPESSGDSRLRMLTAHIPNLTHLKLDSLSYDGWNALSSLRTLHHLDVCVGSAADSPSSAHFSVLAGLPLFARLTLRCKNDHQLTLASFSVAHLRSLARSRSWTRIDLHAGDRDGSDEDYTIRRFGGGPRALKFHLARLDDDEANEAQLAKLRVHLLQGSDDGPLVVWRLVRVVGQFEPPDTIQWKAVKPLV